MRLAIQNEIWGENVDWLLTLDSVGSADFELYDDDGNLLTLPMSLNPLAASLPDSVWVQGLSVGDIVLTLALERLSDGFGVEDTVVLTIGGDLDILSDGPNGGELSEAQEDDPGGLVMVNNDDDDHDGVIDSSDINGVQNENDLIEVVLHASDPPLSTGEYYLQFGSAINVWLTPNRTGPVASNINVFPVNADRIVYVEGLTEGSVQITLGWRNGSSSGIALDEVTFTVFTIEHIVEWQDADGAWRVNNPNDALWDVDENPNANAVELTSDVMSTLRLEIKHDRGEFVEWTSFGRTVRHGAFYKALAHREEWVINSTLFYGLRNKKEAFAFDTPGTYFVRARLGQPNQHVYSNVLEIRVARVPPSENEAARLATQAPAAMMIQRGEVTDEGIRAIQELLAKHPNSKWGAHAHLAIGRAFEYRHHRAGLAFDGHGAKAIEHLLGVETRETPTVRCFCLQVACRLIQASMEARTATDLGALSAELARMMPHAKRIGLDADLSSGQRFLSELGAGTSVPKPLP